MSVEQKAQEALSDMGFPKVKFTGRTAYRGRQRLMFTKPDGDPLLDAPIILEDGDDVEVLPWFDIFDE